MLLAAVSRSDPQKVHAPVLVLGIGKTEAPKRNGHFAGPTDRVDFTGRFPNRIEALVFAALVPPLVELDPIRVYEELEAGLVVLERIDQDAGKVIPRKADLDFSDLELSAGIGFRTRLRDLVIMRTDFAFGSEGFRIAWTFSDIFKIDY